ncbi:MAG TPA: hypothetical protein VGH89_38880 [Pseudonocardia sp.]|jgi:hypothetical protein
MTASDSPGGWVTALIAALDRLAAPSEAQLDYLMHLGVSPVADELGLEFDDLFSPLKPELANRPGWARAVEALEEVDAALSGPDLAWTADALASASEWAHIRLMALTASQLVAEASVSSPLPNSGSVSASRVIRGE